MQEKLYRFTYDKQTGLYKGLTYEQPWADNTTVLQPHFEVGFKTVFDFEFSAWKLVPQEVFFKQMNSIDEIENVVELKNKYITNEIFLHTQHVDEKFAYIEAQNKINFQKTLTEISINKTEIILNRQQIQFLKTEILQLGCEIRNVSQQLSYLEDILIDLKCDHNEHYLYSRKSYWTSRFIDSVTKFAMRCRDIFFKFFNS